MRDAFVVTLAEGVAGVAGFIYLALSARVLGVEKFGLFQAVMGVFSTVMLIGVPLNLAVMHVVSSAPIGARASAAARCLHSGSALALASFAAMAMLSWPLSVWLRTSILPLFAAAAMVMARITTLSLYGTFQGTNRYGAYASSRVMEPVFCLMAGSALLLSGAGVTGVLCGYVAGMAVVVAWWLLRRGAGLHAGGGAWMPDAKTIEGGGRLLVALAGAAAIGDVPMVVARSVMPANDAGIYGTLYTLRHLLLPFCSAVWYPFYTHALTGTCARTHLLAKALLLVSAMGAGLVGVAFLAPELVLGVIFGGQYLLAAPYMMPFAAVLLLQVVAITVLLGSVVLERSCVVSVVAGCAVAGGAIMAGEITVWRLLVAQAAGWSVVLVIQGCVVGIAPRRGRVSASP
jgi:O-antigen/teichoic acid export membrane protein